MKIFIKNESFDKERALYGTCDAEITGCRFEGEADGESALKECKNVYIRDCSFSLRYPLWHVRRLTVLDSEFNSGARAPLWYSENGSFDNCSVSCVKFLRECNSIEFKNCKIVSPEFGWKCSNIRLYDTEVESEYLFFDTSDLYAKNIKMRGKYSFQYMKNVVITDSILDTKDAFWHSENIRVENSVLKGEYLGWFSKNLTLVNCRISGTQPLCYCENLTLINCTMEGCDLSFEYSSVSAEVIGHIDSVKNVRSGKVVADSIGEIINEDSVMECNAEITTR